MVCRAGNDRRRRAVRGLGRALATAAAGRTGRPDRRDLGRDAPARLSPGLRPRPGPGRLGPGSAGRAISDFQALAHLEKLIGPVPSTPTVWRSLDEADAVQVTRIHQATRRFRRLWWAILKSRPEGFPWLSVAGRELTGITVLDLDASVVQVASDQKENAKPTYKGGVGFVPNLATCDNVDDLLMIDPRPGNATSNDAADNIAVLTAAIAAIP